MLSIPPARRARTPIPASPILVVVVLGVAGLATHHVYDALRVTLVAGAARRGESFRDNPHHCAFFPIERAAEISEPFHRGTNRGDRAGHVATLAACKRVAQPLAHPGNRRPRALAA